MTFPVEGNFFNILPHKKHSSRVSFSVSISKYPIHGYLAEVKNKGLFNATVFVLQKTK